MITSCRKTRLGLLCCAALQSFAIAASDPGDQARQTRQQADLYLSPKGSDANPCSLPEPCKTLNKVNAVTKPGDLVYLRNGVYRQRVMLTNSGTRNNPITYQSHPGETAVIDGSGMLPGNPLLWLLGGSWLVIRDIEVRESPNEGIFLNVCNNSVFKNVIVHHSGGDGIEVYDGDNNLFTHVTSHSNYDPATGGNDGIGISFSSAGAANNEVRNSVFYNNSDKGVATWKGVNTLIQDSESYRNGFGTAGAGVGFDIGGGLGTGDNVIRRCVAWGNKGLVSVGFADNFGSLPSTITNNTAWDNRVNYHFTAARHTLKNNISYQGDVLLHRNADQANNTWNLSIANPRFISQNPSSPGFLQLGPRSAAINAGVKTDLPYTGAGPDLGAYEYRAQGLHNDQPPLDQSGYTSTRSSNQEKPAPARLELDERKLE